MKSEQELFWEEVQKIQYSVVNVFLLKMSKYNDMSMLLNDVTYETIYIIPKIFKILFITFFYPVGEIYRSDPSLTVHIITILLPDPSTMLMFWPLALYSYC